VAEGDISAMFERALQRKEYSPELLSRDPYVVLLRSFLNQTEVADVLRVGGHKFERSLAGYSDGVVQARTSSTSWCNVPTCEDDEVMVRVKNKIIDVLQVPLLNTEHLQVLRYEEGQFYRSHHDQNAHVDSAAGPRVYTFFMYLSDVGEGGATNFPKLGISVPPSPGAALIWPSVRDDDVYKDDPRTEHEAKTVLSGSKYGANFWTHMRDFQTPHNAGCKHGPTEAGKQRRSGRDQSFPSARPSFRVFAHGH